MIFQLGTLLILSSLTLSAPGLGKPIFIPPVLLPQTCGTGCLVCNIENSTCKICDFFNNYVQNGMGCAAEPISNCEIFGVDGSCLRCKAWYYPSADLKSCVISEADKKNCRLYSGPSTCSACAPMFYLHANGNCETTAQINNCAFYGGAGICSECAANFNLNEERTACISAGRISNCSRFQNYSCNTCNANSLNNRNTFLIKTFEIDSIADANIAVSRLFLGRNDNLVQSICVTKTVDNCQIFSAYNKCHTCDEGYYLKTDFTCAAYTSKDLSGCNIFSDDDTCTECFNGYYMNNQICVSSTGVGNCEVYSSTSDASDVCDSCLSTHYLSNGSCVARLIIIDNCLRYSSIDQKCEECKSTYQLNNMLNCVLLDGNCAEFARFDDEGNPLECGTCDDGYYLVGGSCLVGSGNCKTYASQDGICEKCIDNYALDGNDVCQAIDFTISNCDEYMTDLPTRCLTCSNNALKFYMTNICVLKTVIAECKDFSDANTCSECNDGFYLSGNTCNEIPASENCINKDDTVCTKCFDGYELFDGACVIAPAIITQNCDNNVIDESGFYNCKICSSDSIPVNVSQICVETDSQSFTIIENCNKYYQEGDDTYKCGLCDLNYGLSKDYTQCLEDCPADQVMYLGALDIDNSSVSIPNFAQCADLVDFTDLSNGCAVASHNLKDSGNVCLKCKDDYIPIETCSMNNTFFNIDNLDDINEGQAFSTISCEAKPVAATFFPTSGSPKAECKHYRPDGTNYYCSQCAFGITGVITEDGSSKPYIDCSAGVTGCNKDAILGSGFVNDAWLNDMYGFSLSYNFTCHVCTDPEQIPFIHMSNKGQLKAYQLNNSDNIPSNATTKDGEMTVCREPTAAGLNVDPLNFTAFVSNCALGLIVTDITKDVTTTASSARCLACKDGFMKVVDDSGFYIESCGAIDNCSADAAAGWLDGCKTCDSTHVKKLDDDSKINPNDCSTVVSEVNAANCRVYDENNSQCVLCERSYSRDLDGNCIFLEFPTCPGYAETFELYSSVTSVAGGGRTVTLINYSYAYYAGVTSYECYKCDTGFISVEFDFLRVICATYENLQNSTAAYIIDDCIKYEAMVYASYTCGECDQDFVRSSDGASCFPSASVENCITASNDGTDCIKCKLGYSNNNGDCEQNISDCYSENFAAGMPTCLECNPGYYLDNNSCATGSIGNCKSYQNSTTCSKCVNGFYLVNNICLELPSHINCDDGDLEFSSENNFECNVCENGYFLTDVTKSDNPLCLNGDDDNCTHYKNAFECNSCDTNYYLDDNNCSALTTVANCASYSTSDDSCLACDSRYYLDSQACEAVTDSIAFCAKYLENDDCAVCTRNMYLSNGACVNVTSKIDNCLFYNNATKCMTCESGYLLVSNTCNLITAADCATYSAGNACSSCPPSYVFKSSGSGDSFKRECESVTIADCAEVNNFISRCKICNKGYIPSGNTCAAPSSVIANCTVQTSATNCAVCDQGFTRSVTTGNQTTTCTKNNAVASLESNCTDLRQSRTAVCTACRPGYVFSSSSCVVQNCSVANCAYCNPNDSTQCYMCSQNYFMAASDTCTANSAGIEGAEFDDEDESTSIYSAFGLLVTLLLALLM